MSRKRIIGFIFLVILLVFIIILANKGNYNSKNNFSNTQENITSNNEDIYNIEIKTEDIIPDEDIPEELEIIAMSQEEKIYSILVLKSFENSKALTTDQYLKVAYNAINNGYISINRKIEDNRYTEKEIKSIIYTIFEIELNENKSIEGLKYQDGIYELEPSNNDFTPVIKNMDDGIAAGTVYVDFELYTEDVSGNQAFKGNYNIALCQNTETGERHIKSMKSTSNN